MTKRVTKQKERVIIPPNMSERGDAVRKLAALIEKTWEPGALHACSNADVTVIAIRTVNLQQNKDMGDIIARVQALMLPYREHAASQPVRGSANADWCATKLDDD